MVIVVTGGIGSGKSEVCRFLEQKGYSVYYSDDRVKQLYVSNIQLQKSLESLLKVRLIDDKGQFDFPLMSKLVFHDKAVLSKVENIVYPFLIDDFNLYKAGKDIVFFESAIILSKPIFNNLYDKVILVDAPIDDRILRVEKRSGLTKSQITDRINNQLIDKNKVDFIINNSSTIEDLQKQVNSILFQLNI